MPISKRRVDEIADISDEDIDYSDIPPMTDEMLANARLRFPDGEPLIILPPFSDEDDKKRRSD